MNLNLNMFTRAFHPFTRATLALAISLILSQARASIGTLDQFNFSGDSITLGTMTNGQYLGQTFRPVLSGIDLFDIQGLSVGISTVQLKLFSGQTTVGIPIASSTLLTITNNSTFDTIEFQFPATVPLVPEASYTARLDLISGDSYVLLYSRLNPYSRGAAFNEFGGIKADYDWVFAEGLISSVPEPSSVLLTGVAFLLLLLRRTISRRV